MQAKYHSGRGYSIAAMSGKFHTAWGSSGVSSTPTPSPTRPPR